MPAPVTAPQPGSLTRVERALLALLALLTALAGAANYSRWATVPRFVLATLALAGLAWLVPFATEQLGERVGPALTGLLQATLGNLPELFVVVFALQKGELVVAQTALVGSIFANALLVLGLVIVVGALRSSDGVMRFSPRLPNDTATLLQVTVFVIVLLGLSLAAHDPASHHVKAISAVGAVCLLAVYASWIVLYLRNGATPAAGAGFGAGGAAAAGAAGVAAAGADGVAAAGVDGAGQGAQPGLRAVGEERGEGASGARLPLGVTLLLLGIGGVGSAFVSDWFIAGLRPAISQLGLSQAFAGLVIVAIAGNAVEHAGGLVLAYRRRNELAISVVKNSVAQIAAMLFPLLVLVSFALSTTLTFALAPVYVGALALTALALWQITGDGEALLFEGGALIALYVILATLTLYE